ncbi:MAG: beta-ketoacyl-[acyl-carrier-protein] synthase family protein [Chitinophagaceae bacterium]
MDRIVVTGMGVISAIGNTVAENRVALMEGKCGIGRLETFPSKFAGILPVGEIRIPNHALQEQLDAYEPGVTRTSLLALYAFKEAITNSYLSIAQIATDTALIGASTVGGMCLTDEMYYDSKKGGPGSEYLSSYDYSATCMYLQKRYAINGPVNTINTACSSSANAIMYGARLIKSGKVKRAIVGGFDSLAKFTINGFNALHILSPEICTPFDADRKGLNLGEGAAFLVLEKESEVADKKIYAALSGYANSNDAFHASSLSENGEGPYTAMESALTVAKLGAGAIDFINAHGTGTENNDQVESVAMMRLFNKVPSFNSTKANIGHTLGAAGAIEAVYCILNLSEQELYPGLHFKTPISGLELQPIPFYKKATLTHVMSNSFGFGGNCSSLIFSKA